jgi:hypothetical protein
MPVLAMARHLAKIMWLRTESAINNVATDRERNHCQAASTRNKSTRTGANALADRPPHVLSGLRGRETAHILAPSRARKKGPKCERFLAALESPCTHGLPMPPSETEATSTRNKSTRTGAASTRTRSTRTGRIDLETCVCQPTACTHVRTSLRRMVTTCATTPSRCQQEPQHAPLRPSRAITAKPRRLGTSQLGRARMPLQTGRLTCSRA